MTAYATVSGVDNARTKDSGVKTANAVVSGDDNAYASVSGIYKDYTTDLSEIMNTPLFNFGNYFFTQQTPCFTDFYK